MNPPAISSCKSFVRSFFTIAILLLIATHTVTIRADSTDGSTPLALKPGAPAGSYALSDLDNINAYNGSLNFRLPLLGIGGRGGAGYTMTLPIEQKWRVNDTPTYLIVYEEGGNGPLPDPQVTHHYFPSANWWSGIKPGYGQGVLQGRVGQLDSQVCPDNTTRAGMTLTRLTFTSPDGTEFELRDKPTGGAPASVGICDQTGLNRGKIFVTADGSAATFISDQNIVDYIVVPAAGGELFYPSGYLLLRDGTRYRFDNGTATWLRDRNGNKITFIYDSFKRATSIKDSLNREVTISYATSSVVYDEIIYKGFKGTQRAIRVNYANLQDTGSLRSGYSIQTYYQLFPISGTSLNTNFNPKIVRSVTLPNNQQYQFQYNSYGELARVVLPTGGAFEYDHASGVAGDASGITSGFEGSLEIYRRVISRRVYADGNTLESKMTFSNTESVPCSGCVVIDQFGSDGTTRLSQRRVFYEGNPVNSFNLGPTDYAPWKDGREYQSESVAANGSTILQRSARTWQQPIAGASWPLIQAETNAAAKANDPQITQVVTTLEPSQANKVSKQTFGYDKYTNQTDVYEYDFGAGTAGSPVRRSHTDYLTSSYDTLNPNSSNPDLSLTSHIRNLPAQASVFDAGGVERARTTTKYDNYTLDGADCQHSFHCPLLLRSSISGLDSLFSSGYTMRGNPTAATSCLLANGSVIGSVSSYTQYDVAGNVVRVLDPRSTISNNIATTIEYDDRFGVPNNEARSNTTQSELTGFISYAFATKVTNALGHASYAQFDYYLGKPVNGEDANGVVASGVFNDMLDRPTQIRRGIGTSAENQTTFAYDDASRSITTSSDRDAADDNLLVSEVFYDKMGRTTETRQYEDSGNFIAVQTQYDALGRPFKISNPFRPLQSEADWTLQAFDSLGRVISVTTPDTAVVSTTYSGNSATVTDQAGKRRKSATDALGRLTDVWEDPQPENPTGLNYQTSYTYDVLDDLVKVTQGSQQRFFMYDSLKRLLRARNPEQGTPSSLNLSDPLTANSTWSIGYQYDIAGNLTKKTDARGIDSTYVYDVLNRNTTVDYSDTVSLNPDVKRFYDGATKGIGRFWYSYKGGDYSNGNNVEHTSIDSYDAMGRPLVQRQLFKLNGAWSTAYQTERIYNRAGGVTTQIYPSGHTVTYAYDVANRTSSFAGSLGDGVTRSYASSFVYDPRNQITQELFGTEAQLYHKLQYNIRGQLWDVRVSTGADINGSWNRGCLQFFYESTYTHGASGPDNNGNVLKTNHYVPLDEQSSTWAIHDQFYNYDSLNRLSSVAEYFVSSTQPVSQQSQQSYSYDRWGNRNINAAQTWGTGINNKIFNVDNATNRLGVPGGQSGVMSYDTAGNLINDTYTGAGAREYDAENKITRAWGGNNQWQEYTYNAEGQRVRRKIDGQEMWQIYGMEGELLAEYAANGSATAPQKEYGYRNGQLLITASSGSGDQSLNLNGTTAYAQVPNSSSLNISGAITVEAWIKVNAITAAYQDIITRESYAQEGTGGGYELSVTNTGKVRLDLYQSPTTYTTVIGSTTITTGVWHHVAGVFDGSQMRVYLDGVLDGTLSTTNAPASGTSSLKIGRTSGGSYFGGLIDEARVSNSAVYTGNFTPQTHLTASGSTKGLWKFDGTSTADSSGNANNGTLQSGATFSSNVPTGPSTSYYSGSFNGTTAYAQVPNSSSLNISGAITVEAWIKVNAITAAYQDLITCESYAQSGTGGGYELSVTNTGKVRLDLYQSPTTYTPIIGSTTITTGVWHHVAGVFDGSQMRVYLDGVLDGTLSTTNAPASGTSSLKIGRTSGGSYFGGLIDEARVSNSAVYTGNFTPQTHLAASSSTKGLWKFDGPSIADSSGNGNTGTLQGGATYSDNVPSGDGGGGGTSSGTGPQVQWLVSDHLGTPRIIIDQTGARTNVKRHDYLPFGEELFAGTGGRSTLLGYTGGDGVRQQFTSKERDNETGLDYFLARYYGSAQGRFTSPDDFLNDTHVLDPASWNLYTYVRNNPLRMSDPSGEAVNGEGLTDRERQKLINDWKQKTGYVDVYFDVNNNLTINRDAGIAIGPDGKYRGSSDARANLTDVIETKTLFNLESANSSNTVAFASVDAGTLSTDQQTGQTTLSYTVKIDFDDFSKQSGDQDAIDSHSLGLSLFHEIDHKLYGEIKDTPNGRNDPGPVERNYINPIREQLGLAQRATYSAVPVGGNLRDAYRGYVQVRFTLSGRDRMLRWRDSVVGGVHR